MMNIPPPPAGARVIILARFSSNMQNPLSADNQIEACLAECKRRGWIVIGTFKDEAKSGRTVANRHGYLEALDVAYREHADAIVVVTLDRLGRSARELHHARDRLADTGTVIFSLDRGVMDRMTFAIMAEVAQMESEKIGERVSFGQRAAIKRGNIMGDLAYGYRAIYDEEGRRLVEIDPDTSKVVVKVLKNYAAGVSPIAIASALTAEGIPTPEGGRIWSPNTILGTRRSGSGLLRNPIYIGKVIYGKTKVRRDPKTGKQIKIKARPEDAIEFESPLLRIVDDELWSQVQDILAARAAKDSVRESRRPDYLLSGLTKCGLCGGAFAMTTDKLGCVNRRVGACVNTQRVEREIVERFVLDGLRNRVVRPPVIDWFLPEYIRETEEARREAASHEGVRDARLREIDQEIANLLKQARAGASGHASRLLNENLDELALEQERLRREDRAAARQSVPAPTVNEVIGKLQTLFDNFGQALKEPERDATLSRDIIRSMIDRIVVTPVGSPTTRAGAVELRLEGKLSAIIDAVVFEGKTQRVRSAEDTLGLTYRILSRIDRPPSARTLRLQQDSTTAAAVIKDSERPIFMREIVDAISETENFANMKHQSQRKRAEAAVRELVRQKVVVCSGRGAHAGWVWIGRGQ